MDIFYKLTNVIVIELILLRETASARARAMESFGPREAQRAHTSMSRPKHCSISAWFCVAQYCKSAT